MDRSENFALNGPKPSDDRNQLLTTPSAIFQALRNAPWQRSHWQMSLTDGGLLEPIAVTLLRVETSGLVFDWPESDQVKQIMGAPEVVFETTLSHPLMRFTVSTLERRMQGIRQVLKTPLPQKLESLVRRNAFRAAVSDRNQALCHLYPDGIREVTLHIVDISDGGIGLLDVQGQVTSPKEGSLFESCNLDLPGIGLFPVRLRVANVRKVTLQGTEMNRLGCTYVGLDPEAQMRINRYVLALQHEAISGARGAQLT